MKRSRRLRAAAVAVVAAAATAAVAADATAGKRSVSRSSLRAREKRRSDAAFFFCAQHSGSVDAITAIIDVERQFSRYITSWRRPRDGAAPCVACVLLF